MAASHQLVKQMQTPPTSEDDELDEELPELWQRLKEQIEDLAVRYVKLINKVECYRIRDLIELLCKLIVTADTAWYTLKHIKKFPIFDSWCYEMIMGDVVDGVEVNQMEVDAIGFS